MNISKLNQAVLVQLLGFIMLVGTPEPAARIIGLGIVIWGGILYRKEQKNLKASAANREAGEPSPPES